MATVKYMTPSAKPITRAQGHNAVKAAAYRSGSKLHDEKNNCDYDFRPKGRSGGVLASGLAVPDNAPEWMHDDNQHQVRERTWNGIEAKEDSHNRRAKAQLAKEFMAPLPRELDLDEQKAVAREWTDGLSKRGLFADWSIHNEQASDGGDNTHMHVMVATRELDADDPTGFGKKWAGDPTVKAKAHRSKSPLDDPNLLQKLKEEYTGIVNRHLEESGSDVRITHLSNEERGIEDKPGVHLGKDAWAMEQKGIRTRLGEHARAIAFENGFQHYVDTPGEDGGLHAGQEGEPGSEWNLAAKKRSKAGGRQDWRDMNRTGKAETVLSTAALTEGYTNRDYFDRMDVLRDKAVEDHEARNQAREEKKPQTERAFQEAVERSRARSAEKQKEPELS